MLADQINLNFENGVRLKKKNSISKYSYQYLDSLKDPAITVALIKIF